MQDKDKFLVEKFHQGDNKAFDELVEIYQSKIYELAYHFTHNVEDALDLSQEIFLRAFRSFSDFKGQSSFYTWLYRIAQNLCIDYIRHKKTVAFAEQTYSEDVLSKAARYSPSQLVETKELESEVAKAIDTLPSRTKSVFILWYYKGIDYKTISEILGCRVGAVKEHLSHGRRMLKKMLAPYLKR
jgi:RNA polymerase sigma-70 factor (ECF subfamily)